MMDGEIEKWVAKVCTDAPLNMTKDKDTVRNPDLKMKKITAFCELDLWRTNFKS